MPTKLNSLNFFIPNARQSPVSQPWRVRGILLCHLRVDACSLFRVRGLRPRREYLKRAARTFRTTHLWSESKQGLAPTSSHVAVRKDRHMDLHALQRPNADCRDGYRKSECAVFFCLPRSLTAAGLSF